MTNKTVDYDKIAPTYDRRFTGDTQSDMAAALLALTQELGKDATSQLALLSEAAYTTGLQRIQAAIKTAEAARERIVFPVDIPVGMLVGCVPGS